MNEADMKALRQEAEKIQKELDNYDLVYTVEGIRIAPEAFAYFYFLGTPVSIARKSLALRKPPS